MLFNDFCTSFIILIIFFCWLDGLLWHYINICHMHHLCHKREKYSGLHSSVLGCGGISKESNVNIVQLPGNTSFCLTGQIPVIEDEKNLIWSRKILGTLSCILCVHMHT